MVGIGIIGTGKQGTDHARRIGALGDRARVAKVHDVHLGRATQIAAEVGADVFSELLGQSFALAPALCRQVLLEHQARLSIVDRTELSEVLLQLWSVLLHALGLDEYRNRNHQALNRLDHAQPGLMKTCMEIGRHGYRFAGQR